MEWNLQIIFFSQFLYHKKERATTTLNPMNFARFFPFVLGINTDEFISKCFRLFHWHFFAHDKEKKNITHTYTHTHTHTHTCTHTNTHTHTHRNFDKHTPKSSHTPVHTNTRTYTYIYHLFRPSVYVFACVSLLFLSIPQRELDRFD